MTPSPPQQAAGPDVTPIDERADGSQGRRRVAVLANPIAGRRSAGSAVDALVDGVRRRGLHATVCWQREEFEEVLRTEADTLRCVVAAGGDGTVNDLLNRAPGLPTAILPLGNENLVARHFALGCSGDELARAIVEGQAYRLDLGRLNGRLFSTMAGVGFDAAVVHQVHRARRGHVNKLSYVLPILRSWRDYAFPEINIDIPETGERLSGTLAFVFNLPEYGLRLPIASQARGDDGRLDLVVFRRPGRRDFVRYGLAVLARWHEGMRDVQHRLVKEVRLSSPLPVPVQTDGDPAGHLPATVEVVAGGLTLLACRPPVDGAY
jgi:diacylglycerol kinase family enzyme